MENDFKNEVIENDFRNKEINMEERATFQNKGN